MNRRAFAWTVLCLLLATQPGRSNFHFMQIEEVIGGVDGNATAQAIQLRLRSDFQNVVSNGSIWAADAAGSNRVLLLNIASNVSNSSGGARVLLATPAFTSLMNSAGGPAFSPDFTLAAAIPAGYLSAGRITFEADGGTVATPGTIYWSLSWGGAGYTGSNTGSNINDSNGNFGPAFGSALPTSSKQGVLFTGAFSAASTSNSTDYALSANPATVTKNGGTSFVVVPEPGTAALLAVGAVFLGHTVWSRRRSVR